jgi:hypothetical protein
LSKQEHEAKAAEGNHTDTKELLRVAKKEKQQAGKNGQRRTKKPR